MANTEDSGKRVNTGVRIHLGATAEREIEAACLEGISARNLQLRLIKSGVVLSEKTARRRMSEWRAAAHRNHQLQQLGIGIGSVHADIAAVTGVLQTSTPEWRQHHIAALRSSFDQFLDQLTTERFTAVVVQCYTLLISSNLQALFERKHD